TDGRSLDIRPAILYREQDWTKHICWMGQMLRFMSMMLLEELLEI
ncbi:unnamed protein product, partial [marine sediment metagenome]